MRIRASNLQKDKNLLINHNSSYFDGEIEEYSGLWTEATPFLDENGSKSSSSVRATVIANFSCDNETDGRAACPRARRASHFGRGRLQQYSANSRNLSWRLLMSINCVLIFFVFAQNNRCFDYERNPRRSILNDNCRGTSASMLTHVSIYPILAV